MSQSLPFAVDAPDIATLRDYAVVLKRRRWIVILITFVTVGATLAVSFARTPLYEARTELLIQPLQAVQDLTGTDAGGSTATDQRIILSDRVRTRVAADLGLLPTDRRLLDVRVTGIAGTRIVEIIATGSDPATTARVADGFAAAYLADRVDSTFARIEQAREALTIEIEALEAEIIELDRRIAAAQASGGIVATPDPAEPVEPPADLDPAAPEDGTATPAPAPEPAPEPAPFVTEGSLQLDRDLLFDNLTTLIARRDALVSDPANLTEGGSVLRPASVPTEPIAPRPVRDGLLALVLGLVVGLALAVLVDRLDDVVRDDVDLRRATFNRPILGRIPRWELVGGRTDGITVLIEPNSIAAETYRELSANVRFLTVAARERRDEAAATASTASAPSLADTSALHGFGTTPVVGAHPASRGAALLVVSATAGNGKSATAANLAVSAARAGQRVVLVDADMRRPRLARQFGLGRSTGLSDVLALHTPVRDHLVKVGVPNLRFLPAGTIPPNPAELLASRAMLALNEELVGEADLVIYDTPALLAVPDALELGRVCDLALLVVRHTTSTRREIDAAIERLEQVGIDLAGSVLNAIDTKSDAYYYYYTYYYRTPYAGAGGTGVPASGERDGGSRRESRGRRRGADAAASSGAGESTNGARRAPGAPVRIGGTDAREAGGGGTAVPSPLGGPGTAAESAAQSLWVGDDQAVEDLRAQPLVPMGKPTRKQRRQAERDRKRRGR